MTLSEYLKVFRQRWLIIAITTLVAAAVMWMTSPAVADTSQKASSYTATATLLVTNTETESESPMGRIALYLTTGEIPQRAAAELGYTGDPAVLASRLTVTPDFTAGALTVAVTDANGERAASIANTFADETVTYFKKNRPGVGRANVSILQRATPIPNVTGGGFVIPPDRTTRTALAAALGLLLGLGLALVLDRVDSRLRSRSEIAAALRLPIIAEVPKMSRSLRRRRSIGVADEPLSPYADGYRGARTALVHTSSLLVQGDDRRPTSHPEPVPAASASLILVTSAHPREGKTTSVANLAASFAETGQRILVLDGDLRSPDTHNIFDVPQGAGISDYLTGPDDTPLESLIRPTNVPGVRIITAGTRLEHPASLASRMGGLLTEARGLADVVLVDSAPLLAASDVFDVLPLVDTVLLVVRSGRLTEVAGHRVSELLGRFQVPVAGVVVVGAQSKRSAGYGYGYGYGYGDKKKGKAPRRLPPPAVQGPPERSEERVPESRSARREASRKRNSRRTSSSA